VRRPAPGRKPWAAIVEKRPAVGGGMRGLSGERPTTDDLRRWTADITRCRVSGRTDELLSYFAPGVDIYLNCCKPGLNASGVRMCRDGFREHLRLTDIEYESLGGEVRDVIGEGDRSVVLWRSGWRHRGTGKSATIDMLHFLRWREGLVVELQEFMDYAVAGSALRPFRSFEDMLQPRPPGLDRDEIVRRSEEFARFPSSGPALRLMRELCATDIVCEFPGDRTRIPFAGRYVGVEALANIVRGIAIEFEQTHQQLTDVVVDGGRIAGLRTVEWRNRGTGRWGEVRLADFMRFEDGLITEIVEFRDTVTMLDMLD